MIPGHLQAHLGQTSGPRKAKFYSALLDQQTAHPAWRTHCSGTPQGKQLQRIAVSSYLFGVAVPFATCGHLQVRLGRINLLFGCADLPLELSLAPDVSLLLLVTTIYHLCMHVHLHRDCWLSYGCRWVVVELSRSGWQHFVLSAACACSPQSAYRLTCTEVVTD